MTIRVPIEIGICDERIVPKPGSSELISGSRYLTIMASVSIRQELSGVILAL